MQTEKLANQRFLLIFIFSLRLIRRSSGRSETNETDYDVNVSETTRGRFLSVVVETIRVFLMHTSVFAKCFEFFMDQFHYLEFF